MLEIGTGSGYQAAILAELAAEVITIERRPELADAARSTLALLGYPNVEVIVGDGTLGLADRAPFDRILVTAGAPRVPEALTRQLSGQRRPSRHPCRFICQQWLTIVVREGDRLTKRRARRVSSFHFWGAMPGPNRACVDSPIRRTM